MLDSIKLDSGCNKKSVMYLSGYTLHFLHFGLQVAINNAVRTVIQGMDGRGTPIGTAWIQIPFPGLTIIVDVNFPIVNEDVLTLLSMNGILYNHIEISTKRGASHLKESGRTLRWTIIFPIQSRQQKDLSHTIYYEKKLRPINQSFRHPSIRALEALLRRPSRMLPNETRESIGIIGSTLQR